MRMTPPAVDPRLKPTIDGQKIPVGAHVFKDGKPITITFDNGVFFEWIEGHQYQLGSNDRSGLALAEEG